MRFAVIALALVSTACASSRPDPAMPEIAATPSRLVFTGDETCETLFKILSRAFGDEQMMVRNVVGNLRAREARAVFTLGMSELELNSYIRAVAFARGDLAAVRSEISRRGCNRPALKS